MMTRSEGPSIQRSRAQLPRSPSDGPYSTPSNHDRRNLSIPAWQNGADGNYTSSPAVPHGRKRRREPVPVPMRTPTTRHVPAMTYLPEEFVSIISDPSPIPPVHRELLANDTPANHYLSVNTDPMIDRSLSFDGPPTPSTPATAVTETSTPSQMSRNGSIASYNSVSDLLTQGVDLLRVSSQFSFPEEDNQTTFDLPTDFNQEEFIIPDLALCYHQSDPNFFVTQTHDQDASAASSFNFSSNSPNEISSHFSTSSHNTLVMKRLSSTQNSESDSSTSQSRSSRRHQEQLRQGNTPIAPKVNASEKLSPTTRMVRVTSEDGSVQVKAEISRKTPYQRPQHPKLFCNHCDDIPDGFRGDHELQRHINRAHPSVSGVRKVWICVDVHGDGTWLERCKACRTRKQYGTNYNAAAQ